MSNIYDPRLGTVLSAHRASLIYPILSLAICLPLSIGGFYVSANGGGNIPLILAAISLAFMTIYIGLNRKKKLTVCEHGICIESISGMRSILWRNITKVTITYSCVQNPYSVIDISIRQSGGPRIVVNTNWSNRRQLIENLRFLFTSKA